MNLGVTSWTLPSRGLTGLRWAASLGFGLAHLDFEDVKPKGCDDAGNLAAAADGLGLRLGGFALSQLESVGLGREVVARQIVDVGIDVAAELGVDLVYLPSFEAAEIRTFSDLCRTADLMHYALERTENSSIAIASENTLNGPAIRKLFGLVDHPRACLLFDTQNPCFSRQDPTVLAAQVADLVGPYVHVKDGCRAKGDAIVGSGLCNVAATLDALMHGGFDGLWVLESDYRSGDITVPQADQEALSLLLRSWHREVRDGSGHKGRKAAQ